MEELLKKKILLVEDEKAISKALQMKLINEGFEVIPAYDGEEAVSIFSAGGIDLVLLDLIIPKKDGFSVLEEIRNRDRDVPIIISSNLSQQNDLEKAKNLGASDYFIKSDTSIVEVVGHVKKFLQI